MKRVLAIARLTFTAALRYRLVLVLGLVLIGAVVALPMLVKDDGTAQGFTQILLTYTLSIITAILGFTNLWLACGSLAREVEECQLQMVVVKPVARWQIWLGKWLGIMFLNMVLLAPSSLAIYGLLEWRAQRLPPAQQEVLRNEVLVARGSVREEVTDVESDVEKIFQARLKEAAIPPSEHRMLREQIRQQVRAGMQIVRSGYMRRWVINLGPVLGTVRDKPLFIRARFTVAQETSTVDEPRTYDTMWQAGVPQTTKFWQENKRLASQTYHEWAIPPNLFDDKGVITIDCANMSDGDMLFQLDDGLELLYREGGFGLNFFRGIVIVFCWLALLAAIGLASASFLSFPVAAFLAMGILVVGLSSGTLAQVVEEGGVSGVNHDTGRIDTPRMIDRVAVPLFSGMLKVVNLVRGFSPIDNLSTGRSITWMAMGQAVFQIIIVLGGFFALFGIIMLTRRELATAQGNQ